MRFALALVLLLVAPLAAAQTDTRSVAPPEAASPAAAVPTARAKSPALGHVFGYLLPGGGHFYAGEPSTGGVLLGTYVAGAAIALPALLAQGVCQVVGAYSSCEPSAASSAQIVIGSVMAGGALLYSVVDGGRAVRRTNGRNRYAAAIPRATVAPHGAGLAMRVRL